MYEEADVNKEHAYTAGCNLCVGEGITKEGQGRGLGLGVLS